MQIIMTNEQIPYIFQRNLKRDLKKTSLQGESTFNFPLLKATAETCNEEYPKSTKTTFLGLSVSWGRSVLYSP